MSDPERNVLNPKARRLLLEVAHQSIDEGLNRGHPMRVDIRQFPQELQQQRASFVTLHRNHQLRGCIGHLEAIQTLVEDIAENAYAAAFRDPRFPQLSKHEFPDLDIHISVLSPAEAMSFDSETDLISQLQPGIDGLILHDGAARGTFLPSVWESLPNPQDFFDHLKRKAGLSANHWSSDLNVWRYKTESFGHGDS